MGRASDPSERKREEKFAASERAARRFLERLAVHVEFLSRYIEDPPDGETWITAVQFKMNSGWDGGVLAIVKADVGGEAKVGFHNEPSFDECIAGLSARLANGSMTWKEDVPYEKRNASKPGD